MADATIDPTPPQWHELLAKTDVFRTFPADGLETVDGRAQRLPAGAMLVEDGEDASSLYLVVEGRMEAFVESEGDEHRYLTYEPGDLLGALVFFLRSHWPVSVRAVEDTVVVAMDDFSELMSRHPEQADHVVRALETQMRRHQIAWALYTLLGEESHAAYEGLSEAINWRRIKAGETLRRVDEPVDGLAVVITGALEIVDPAPGHDERPLAVVERGGVVGALEVLAATGSMHTVVAARETEYLWIEGAALRGHAQAQPAISEILLRSVTRVLRDPSARWKRSNQHVAVLPVGDPDGLDAFTDRLVKALEATTPHVPGSRGVSVISRARILGAIEADHLSSALKPSGKERFVQLWLLAREHWHHTMVYVGDGIGDDRLDWAERIVRQADEILWVAHAAQDKPELGEVEKALRDLLLEHTHEHHRHLRHRLVLLHDEGRSPEGTSAWLACRPWLRLHHHVRENRADDVERLARFATGRAVGLVMSGGGARGFAHVGVVEAFEAAGQPVDCLAGVSMGAVVASMIGQEWDPDDTMAQAQYLADEFLDRTLPMVALGSAGSFGVALEKVYGDTMLEDLWRPAFFMSANLTEAGETYLRHGLLREAVRASNAPAGLAPPVVTTDGDMLADGFIINNMPVDLMRQLHGCSEVIAVDVMPSINMAPVQPYGDKGLSGWSILWRKLWPFATPVDIPGIQHILTRALELSGLRHQREAEASADRYLRPPVEQFGTFEYDKGDRIRSIGHHYATTYRGPATESNAGAATEGVVAPD